MYGKKRYQEHYANHGCAGEEVTRIGAANACQESPCKRADGQAYAFQHGQTGSYFYQLFIGGGFINSERVDAAGGKRATQSEGNHCENQHEKRMREQKEHITE